MICIDSDNLVTISNEINFKGNGNINAPANNLSNNDCTHNYDNDNNYVKDSYCRKIYANTNGYAAVDGGSKGGYLIRSLVKVISNPQAFEEHDLDGIIRLTRQLIENLIGQHAAQVLEDVNTLPDNVSFQSKKINVRNHVNAFNNITNDQIDKLDKEIQQLKKQFTDINVDQLKHKVAFLEAKNEQLCQTIHERELELVTTLSGDFDFRCS